MLNLKKSLAQSMLASVLADNYELTDSGIVFPRESIKISGTYRMDVDGQVTESKNLVTKEGMIHLLNVSLGNTPKPAAYYIALFTGSTAPALNWTGSNFAAAASELVSLTEGYTLATRIPLETTNASADTHIDNYGKETEITFATASTIRVTGAALLTASAKGATSGVCVSASLYPGEYTFHDGNTFKVGYRLNATQ